MKKHYFYIFGISLLFLTKSCHSENLDQSTQFPSIRGVRVQYDCGLLAGSSVDRQALEKSVTLRCKTLTTVENEARDTQVMNNDPCKDPLLGNELIRESSFLKRMYSPYSTSITERAALFFYVASLIHPDCGQISAILTLLNICQRLYSAYIEGSLSFPDYTAKGQPFLKGGLSFLGIKAA